MDRFLITIDGGTTNTRTCLWNSSGRIVCSSKSETGVRNTAIDDSSERLKTAVRELISSLLAKGNISMSQVASVYASGMITSNVGLVEIPHLTAPASLEDFAAGVQVRTLPDVCPLPIHFIPGLKNLPAENINLDNIDAMDMMRGEETEALAMLSGLDLPHGCLLVLPGSHTKFVTVDFNGRLTGCLTSLTGELLSILTEYSVIADAVNRRFVNGSCDLTFLKAGFRDAGVSGCARAAFLTRIISQFITRDQNLCASYLLGVVLQNDMAAIRNSRALKVNPNMHVLVSGKEPLRSAMTTLLLEDGYFTDITAFDPDPKVPLAALGARLLAVRNGDFQED